MKDDFDFLEDRGFKPADKGLRDRMEAAIKANAIPNDPDENEALCAAYTGGEKILYCQPRIRKASGDTVNGPHSWAAVVSLRGCSRTIYRGTLYQCALAVDCWTLTREPFSKQPYDKKPVGRQCMFRLGEDTVKYALENPVLADYMNFLVERFQAQGLLRTKRVKEDRHKIFLETHPQSVWERWEKLFERLNETDAQLGRMGLDLIEVRNKLDALARRLDEQSSRLVLPGGGLVPGCMVVDHAGGIVEIKPTPPPENTKAWPAGEYPYNPETLEKTPLTCATNRPTPPENTKEPSPISGCPVTFAPSPFTGCGPTPPENTKEPTSLTPEQREKEIAFGEKLDKEIGEGIL